MIFKRIITDADGVALHILRPGGPPEVLPLSLGELATLVADASAALRDEVKQRGRRPIQPVASEPAGTPYVGRLGE